MKIIQISSYYPPHLGGQENAVRDLSRQLASSDHEVHVITSTCGGGKKGHSVEDGVNVWRLAALEFGHAPIMPAFVPTLMRLATPGSVIHLHIGQAFSPEWTRFASKLRSFPYIAELHIDFEPSGPAGVLLPLYKRLALRPVLRAAHTVAVLNQKTSDLVKNVYGVTKKTYIVNNGIDEDYFAVNRPEFATTPPQRLKLLFVGRLSKQKNVPALITALPLTKRNVHLDIVGDGDQRGLIEQTIKDHNVADRVTLHGRLDRQQVLEFYRGSDVLVMPSLYEAQPLVLLEALATRIPIIGTDVIGVAEHIADAGVVVQPTPEALAAGFDEYYRRYSQLPDLVEHGYQKAVPLRWQNLLPTYETLYREAL